MQNTIYFLALAALPGVGPRTIKKLLNFCPDLAEIFNFSVMQLIEMGFSKKIAIAINSCDFKQAELDLKWQQEAPNRHLLTLDDNKYPKLLKEIYDPPAVLYAVGELSSLFLPAVAIIGSRNPSPAGKETAYRFAYELAQHNITVISGLAAGIDAAAHQGCIAASGRTIAVLGSGFNYIYPAKHQSMAKQIMSKGLLISEFSLNTKPKAGHFPQRNRIISGLSLSILVVEAAIKSGSLITARLAIEQNRDVMAIPGSILNPQARGCHYLLQQGAKLITSSEEILSELGLIVNPELSSLQDDSYQKNSLIKYIGFEITTIDKIIARSGLTFDSVVCELAALEIQGKVQSIPGGYIRCV